MKMGWAQSTETVADITNSMQISKPHPLLPSTQTAPLPQPKTFTLTAIVLGNTPQPPLNYTDVFINDFMIVAQHQQNLPTLNTLLHTINTVTASMTIALPHRAENITTMLMDTRTKQRTSKQKRQQLLGILHSLSPVIYDAAHLIWFYNMRSQRHI